MSLKADKRLHDSSNTAQKANIVLVDIEGTTTSITFVKDTLFPYVRQKLETYVRNNWGSPKFQEVLTLLREQVRKDVAEGVEGAVAIPEGDGAAEAAVKNVLWQMDLDRKTKALKQLQGHIWREGYKNGELKGHVYPDVVAALKAWVKDGRQVYVYSSGSVEAQKLLFGHLEEGSVLEVFSGHFDTEVGPKVETSSYMSIANKLGSSPGNMVFFTDVVKEAEAAKSAGLSAVLVMREGNAPVSDEDIVKFPVIRSFQDYVFEVSAKKQKLCLDDEPVETGKVDTSRAQESVLCESEMDVDIVSVKDDAATCQEEEKMEIIGVVDGISPVNVGESDKVCSSEITQDKMEHTVPAVDIPRANLTITSTSQMDKREHSHEEKVTDFPSVPQFDCVKPSLGDEENEAKPDTEHCARTEVKPASENEVRTEVKPATDNDVRIQMRSATVNNGKAEMVAATENEVNVTSLTENADEMRPTTENKAIEMRPAIENEAVEMRPTIKNEAVEMRPTIGSDAVEMRPATGSEAVELRPATGSEAVELRPATGSEAVELRPTTGSKAVELGPTTGSKAVELGPTTGSKAVELGPTTGSEAVELGPTTGSEAVELGPTTGSEAVEMRPATGSKAVELGPTTGSEAVELGPTTGSEAVEMRPATGSENIETRPSTGKAADKMVPFTEEETVRMVPVKGKEAVESEPVAEEAVEMAPAAEKEAVEMVPAAEKEAVEMVPAAEKEAVEMPPAAEKEAVEMPPAAEKEAVEMAPAAEEAVEMAPAAEEAVEMASAAEEEAVEMASAAEEEATVKIAPATKEEAAIQIAPATKEVAVQIAPATKEEAVQIAQAAKEAVEMASTAKEDAVEMASAAKEDAVEMASAAKEDEVEMASAAKEDAVEMASAAKEDAVEMAPAAKEKAAEMASAAKEEATVEMAPAAKEKAAEMAPAAIEEAAEMAPAAIEEAAEMAHAAIEEAAEMAHAAKEAAVDIALTAQKEAVEMAHAAEDDFEMAHAAEDDVEMAPAADDDVEMAPAAEDDVEMASATEKEAVEMAPATEEESVFENETLQMEPAPGKETVEAVPALKKEAIEAVPALKKEAIEAVPALKKEAVEAVPAPEKEAVEAVPVPEKEAVEAVPAPEKETVETVPAPEKETVETVPTPEKETVEAVRTSEKEAVEAVPASEKEAVEAVRTSEKEAVEAVPASEKEAVEAVPASEKEAVEAVPAPEKEAVEAVRTSKKEVVGVVPTQEKEAIEAVPSLEEETTEAVPAMEKEAVKMVPASENEVEMLPASENEVEMVPASENEVEMVPAPENEAVEMRFATEKVINEIMPIAEIEAAVIRPTMDDEASEARPTMEDEASEARPTMEDEASEARPTMEDEASEARPTMEDEASEARPTMEDEASEARPTMEDEASEARPTMEDEASEARPAMEDEASETRSSAKDQISEVRSATENGIENVVSSADSKNYDPKTNEICVKHNMNKNKLQESDERSENIQKFVRPLPLENNELETETSLEFKTDNRNKTSVSVVADMERVSETAHVMCSKLVTCKDVMISSGDVEMTENFKAVEPGIGTMGEKNRVPNSKTEGEFVTKVNVGQNTENLDIVKENVSLSEPGALKRVKSKMQEASESLVEMEEVPCVEVNVAVPKLSSTEGGSKTDDSKVEINSLAKKETLPSESKQVSHYAANAECFEKAMVCTSTDLMEVDSDEATDRESAGGPDSRVTPKAIDAEKCTEISSVEEMEVDVSCELKSRVIAVSPNDNTKKSGSSHQDQCKSTSELGIETEVDERMECSETDVITKQATTKSETNVVEGLQPPFNTLKGCRDEISTKSDETVDIAVGKLGKNIESSVNFTAVVARSEGSARVNSEGEAGETVAMKQKAKNVVNDSTVENAAVGVQRKVLTNESVAEINNVQPQVIPSECINESVCNAQAGSAAMDVSNNVQADVTSKSPVCAAKDVQYSEVSCNKTDYNPTANKNESCENNSHEMFPGDGTNKKTDNGITEESKTESISKPGENGSETTGSDNVKDYEESTEVEQNGSVDCVPQSDGTDSIKLKRLLADNSKSPREEESNVTAH